MKNIFDGSKTVEDIYYGDVPVTKVYNGSELIWERDGDEPSPIPELVGDWYVSPTGLDTNDGTSRSTPFRTIQHAVDVSSANQTIVVMQGTHELNSQVTINKAITVIGEGWNKTVVQPTSGIKVRVFELNGGGKLERMRITGGEVNGEGGGALVKNGTISWCRITGNKSTINEGSGGGVSFAGGQGQIDHSIVENNQVGLYGYGAGIGTRNTGATGPVLIDTCLVTGNSGSSTYGGQGIGFMYLNYAVTIRNCTIVGNADKNFGAGGIYINGVGGGVKPTLVNTIVCGNTSNGADKNLACGTQFSGFSDDSGYCFFGLQTEASKIPNSSYGDPLFVNVVNHDYHVKPNSYVLGHGSTYSGIGDTLDGFSFLNPPAIGCYELCGVPRVKITDVGEEDGEVEITIDKGGVCMYYTTDGSEPTAASTLYAQKFNVSGTTKINILVYDTENDVWGDLYTTWYVTPQNSASDNVTEINSCIEDTSEIVFLSSGEFRIDKQLLVNDGKQLIGQGWENTVIKQMTSGANSRCVNVSVGSLVEGVTLTGGHLTGNWAGGAGAEVNGGRISWCCVSGNIVDTGNNTHGAGIRIGQNSQGGQIDHTIVIGNTVGSVGGADSPPYGGGVSIFNSSGNVLIDTCLIVGNEANYPAGKYARGGGISLESVGAEVVIRNTSIVGNKAINSSDAFHAEGGGLYVSGSVSAVKHLRMENCIVADNETKGSSASDVVSTTNDVIDYCIFDKEADKNGEHSAVASSESIFVDAADGNYHLSNGSLARNAGVVYDGIGVDLDKFRFDEPPSVGCYEYDINREFVYGWNSRSNLGVETDIINEGESIYAYHAGSGSLNVNGVTFQPWTTVNDSNSEMTCSSGSFEVKENGGNDGVSGDYGTMLSTVWYNGSSVPSNYTITLKNLTPGEKYLIQTIHHYNNGRPVFTVKDSNPIVFGMPNDQASSNWIYGCSFVGLMTSDSSGEITLELVNTEDSPFTVNAVQVRRLISSSHPKFHLRWDGGVNATTTVIQSGVVLTNGGLAEADVAVIFVVTPKQDCVFNEYSGWTAQQDGSLTKEVMMPYEDLSITIPSAVRGWDYRLGTFTKRLVLQPFNSTWDSTFDNFPVVVRLNTDVQGFDYSECGANGENLVFCDGFGNILAYEIETWNTGGESLIWVNVPQLSSNTQFYMYYGGTPSSDLTIPSSTKTWTDSNYVGVWHMIDPVGSKLHDSTGHGLDGTQSGAYPGSVYTGSDAPYGMARATATQQQEGYVLIPNYNSFNVGNTFTISCWTKADIISGYPRLMSRKNGYQDANGWETEFENSNANKLNVRGTDSAKGTQTLPIPVTQAWSHLAIVYSGALCVVYQNGQKLGSATITPATDNGLKMSIGCDSNGDETKYRGKFSEVRLLDEVITDDWAKVEYEQGSPDFLSMQVQTVSEFNI